MNVFKKCLTLFLTACVCMTVLLSCGTGNEDTPAATTAATTLSPEEIPARPTQDQSYEETVRNAFSNVAEPDAERFTYAVLESGVTLTGYTGDLPRLKLPSEIEGKPVVAIPYAPGSLAGAGCNALLKKGGYLTENSVDISGRFGINLIEKKRAAPELSADEKKMLGALKELAEGHISELSQLSGVPAYKARAVLSSLEVKGLVAPLGGNRYAPV